MALWNAEAGGFGDVLSLDSKSEDAKQEQGDTLGTYSQIGGSEPRLLHECASASGPPPPPPLPHLSHAPPSRIPAETFREVSE